MRNIRQSHHFVMATYKENKDTDLKKYGPIKGKIKIEGLRGL